MLRAIAMNIEWFHCFVETVHSKSLLKTSLALNISQPAASKQIQKLEQTFGVMLFRRSHKGMELTEAGRILYNRIRPVLSELAAIQRELQNVESLKQISLGTLPSLAAYYLPSRVNALQKQGTTVALQVFNTSREALEQLRAGQLDGAIVQMAPSLQIEEFPWHQEVLTEPYYAIVPLQHSLSQRRAVTMTDLRREAIVTYPSACDTRQSIVRSYEYQGWQPKVVTEIGFGESILNFVASGAGITIVPQIIAAHANHLSVVTLPIRDFSEQRTLVLVTRSERIGKLLHQQFING